MTLSLLEAGRLLGGLSPAEVCALIVSGDLPGCLVDCSLKVEADVLRAFIGRKPPLQLLQTPQASPVAPEDQPNGPEVTQ